MSNEILVRPGEDTPDLSMSALEVMQHLDDTQRERYAAFQETFESAGWSLVVEWAQVKALEAEKVGMRTTDEAEWRRQQGVRDAWMDVAQMAEMFMNSFENTALQNKIDSEESLADDLDLGDGTETP